MEFLIHDFSALYFILKAHKGPTVGAKISGHALHVLKTVLYTIRHTLALCTTARGSREDLSIQTHNSLYRKVVLWMGVLGWPNSEMQAVR